MKLQKKINKFTITQKLKKFEKKMDKKNDVKIDEKYEFKNPASNNLYIFSIYQIFNTKIMVKQILKNQK